MTGSSTRHAPARGSGRSGSSGRWRLGVVLAGVLALLALATLAVLARGSPATSTTSTTSTPPTTQKSTTPPDSVTIANKNPNAGNPQNTVTLPPSSFPTTGTGVYTVSAPVPPQVTIASAVVGVEPTQAGGYCNPTDQQQFTITGTLTTHDTTGGVAQFVWMTSDGYRSSMQTVTFAKGQTTAKVHDVWTLGAWYADGSSRWEALKVVGPNTLVSNHASFVYNCAPVVYNTTVSGIELCDGTTWLVTAEIDVFAPAGGSVTFDWSDLKNGTPLGQAQTLTIPAGIKGVTVIARWHVGSAPVTGDGVTVTALNGQVLATPQVVPTTSDTSSDTSGQSQNTPDQSGTQNGSQGTTPPAPTVCTATITPSPTSGTVGKAQPVTFTGAIQLNINTPTTLTYEWVRSDGTTTTPATLSLLPGIDPTSGTQTADDTASVTDTWTPPTAAGTYTDTLVISQEGGYDLPDSGTGPNSLTPGGVMTLGHGTYAVVDPNAPVNPPAINPPVVNPPTDNTGTGPNVSTTTTP